MSIEQIDSSRDVTDFFPVDPECGMVMPKVCLDFLYSRGYQNGRGGVIYYPNGKDMPTIKEMAAIDYLFNEWDYGFLKRGEDVDE